MLPATQPSPIDASLEFRISQRVKNLPAELQSHIARAQDVARELAPWHGVDAERAAFGILAHDVARAMKGPELIDQANRFKLPIGSVEEQVPMLLHGPVGAEILRVEDGLAATSGEGDIYQAVYWHTTFHPTLLDNLGKVVFLADKLDPNKRKRIPYQSEILEMAWESLDAAVLEFLDRQARDLVQRGHAVHPMMLEARDALKAKLLHQSVAS